MDAIDHGCPLARAADPGCMTLDRVTPEMEGWPKVVVVRDRAIVIYPDGGGYRWIFVAAWTPEGVHVHTGQPAPHPRRPAASGYEAAQDADRYMALMARPID